MRRLLFASVVSVSIQTQLHGPATQVKDHAILDASALCFMSLRGGGRDAVGAASLANSKAQLKEKLRRLGQNTDGGRSVLEIRLNRVLEEQKSNTQTQNVNMIQPQLDQSGKVDIEMAEVGERRKPPPTQKRPTRTTDPSTWTGTPPARNGAIKLRHIMKPSGRIRGQRRSEERRTSPAQRADRGGSE
eukprot:CAMPEP_0202825674 /NCGR_PEP_ID=MMETSP1389-20130828/13167_1 /ASSEMBLY_ACC=CAM_ASM_000865 /TAXON_ID=302021 /ORGANISM="Rhodomonas sp., Strain CCMP768" /LENGTH=187 /DNA_ID=CAMNT_0049498917 /DNA_START=50 /DNA_END=610 /DNA_ORIENTATION=-